MSQTPSPTLEQRPALQPVPPPATGPAAIAVQGLTRRYADRLAVDDLSFTVPAGTVCGFVGPNGAGKTTTIRMLLGLIAPTAGSGHVLGHPLTEPAAFLPQVGAMIEGPTFYPTLTAHANLRALAALSGVPAGRVEYCLATVGLSDRAGDAYRTFSLGMKQRLGIAAALLNSPQLLILDEPTNGLDPAGIVEVRVLLRQLADAGTTVFVSSHLLAEVEQVADHLVMVADGRLKFAGTVGELLAARQPHLLASLELPASGAGPLLAELTAHGLLAHLDELGRLHVETGPDRAGWLNRTAMALGVTFTTLQCVRPSLEDAFFDMTGAQA